MATLGQFSQAMGTVTGFNGTTSADYGNITYTVTPARNVLVITHPIDDPVFTFTGEENGQFINLELTPERDIKPYEQLLISNMISSIAIGVRPSCSAFMQYVRKHNLERHFKFTAA